jgi:hypothetical protein
LHERGLPARGLDWRHANLPPPKKLVQPKYDFSHLDPPEGREEELSQYVRVSQEGS